MDQDQGVIVNGVAPGWQPVTGRVPQGSFLGSALFSVLINDLDTGAEHTLSKLVDSTNLVGVVNSLKGRGALQRDLDRLQHWAITKCTKFNTSKCRIPHLERCRPECTYRLGDMWLERDLGFGLTASSVRGNGEP